MKGGLRSGWLLGRRAFGWRGMFGWGIYLLEEVVEYMRYGTIVDILSSPGDGG